jgi:hypothetical protein
VKAISTLGFSIERENKRPDMTIGDHLAEPSLDLGVNSLPLPFQLTDGSCLWTILQQPVRSCGPRYSELLTPSTRLALQAIDNQWLYGFF